MNSKHWRLRLNMLLFLLGSTGMALAQTTANKEVFAQLEFYVFSITYSPVQAECFSFLMNPALKPNKEIVQQAADSCGQFFLINGGTVREDNGSYQPVGLFVAEEQAYTSLNLADDQGNFFLKPNGVFYIAEQEAGVMESSAFQQAGIKPLAATQSGPILLLDEMIHSSFQAGSANVQLRCGVGISEQNGRTTIHFAISRQSVNLYTFARFFKERFQCKNALCLESAGVTMELPYFPLSKDDLKIGTYIYYSSKKCKMKINK